MKTKPQKDKPTLDVRHWRPWFAWYPVKARWFGNSDVHCWVWLEFIESRYYFERHRDFPVTGEYQYRTIK